MYPDHQAHEAMVPVTVVSFTLVYCHQCQAWRRYSQAGTLQDQDTVGQWAWGEADFGPFDDEAEVLRDITEQLERMLRDPVAPWLLRHHHRPA